jgi:hypothetical protein
MLRPKPAGVACLILAMACRQRAGIDRLAHRGGAPRRARRGLILAPLATPAAVDGLAADRATGIGPGAATRHVEGRDPSPASLLHLGE